MKWVKRSLALVMILLLGTGCQVKKNNEVSVKSSEGKIQKSVKVDWPYYEIRKNDQVLGHLLGTIHIGKKEMYPFPEKIRADLSGSNLLVTEVTLDSLKNPNNDLVMSAMRGDKSITEGMSKESLKLFKKRLKDYGFTLDEVENLNRFGVDQMFQTKIMNMSDVLNGVEMHLESELRGLETLENIGFETVGEQYQLLGKAYEEPKNVDEWVKSILPIKETKKLNKELLDSYLKGEVFKYFEEEPVTETQKHQNKVLLDERNHNWMKSLPDYLTNQGPVFVAVGAGHLPSGEGLLKLLEEAGYQTKEVKFE